MRRMLKELAPKVFVAELAKSIGEKRGNKELAREKNYLMSNIASINYRIFQADEDADRIRSNRDYHKKCGEFQTQGRGNVLD